MRHEWDALDAMLRHLLKSVPFAAAMQNATAAICIADQPCMQRGGTDR